MTNTIDSTIQYVTGLTQCFCPDDINAATLAILIDMGFSVQSDGFIYLRFAIQDKFAFPHHNCQSIYEAVIQSTGCHITPQQIEQAIRSSISSAWSSGADRQWELLFPSGASGRRTRPSNYAFISRIACILELRSSCRGNSFGNCSPE